MADPKASNDMILGEMRGQMREVIHAVNGLSQKFDALSREVVGLGPLAVDVVQLEARVASLELEKSRREGAQGVMAAIAKSPFIAWLIAAVAAVYAFFTGKIQI